MTGAVGVIGLGRMGAPMAARLLAAGRDVIVYNRTTSAVEPLVERGARAAGSPAELAREADVVITVLADPAAVEEVVLGGVLEAARDGLLAIDMSTSTPALAVRIHAALGERGTGSIDAPVSGGVAGARDGTLSIMAGGDAEDVDRARPVLEALGARITHVGGPGSGQIVKAANQLVVALNIQAVAEALTLAGAAGVDPAVVREAFQGGFADSTVLGEHGRRMVERDFEPGGAMRLHLKDLRIGLDLARQSGIELPAAREVADRFAGLVEAGEGERDHSALLLAYERNSDKV